MIAIFVMVVLAETLVLVFFASRAADWKERALAAEARAERAEAILVDGAPEKVAPPVEKAAPPVETPVKAPKKDADPVRYGPQETCVACGGKLGLPSYGKGTKKAPCRQHGCTWEGGHLHQPCTVCGAINIVGMISRRPETPADDKPTSEAATEAPS